MYTFDYDDHDSVLEDNLMAEEDKMRDTLHPSEAVDMDHMQLRKNMRSWD